MPSYISADFTLGNIQVISTSDDDLPIIATADIINFNQITHQNKKAIQSRLVRLLLAHIQSKLKLPAILIEHSFPYYFNHQGTKYFVCFSHSMHKIALIITPYPCAIDIELRIIPIGVAKRYFCFDEIAFINKLPPNEQSIRINTLWCLKECFIKLNNGTLTKGMNTNLAHLIPSISFATPSAFIDKDYYYIINPKHHLCAIIKCN